MKWLYDTTKWVCAPDCHNQVFNSAGHASHSSILSKYCVTESMTLQLFATLATWFLHLSLKTVRIIDHSFDMLKRDEQN